MKNHDFGANAQTRRFLIKSLKSEKTRIFQNKKGKNKKIPKKILPEKKTKNIFFKNPMLIHVGFQKKDKPKKSIFDIEKVEKKMQKTGFSSKSRFRLIVGFLSHF